MHRRTRPGVRSLLLALIAVAGAIAVFPAAVLAASPQTVHLGSTPVLPDGAKVVGSVPSTQRLALTVALKSQDPSGLERFATEVSTPGTPLYRHYISVAQFAQSYGATPAQIEQVGSALSAHGLDVGQPMANDLLLPVTGTAAQVEAAFSVGLSQITLPTGRNAYLNQQAPSVAASIAPYIQAVFGLNSVAIPETKPPAATPSLALTSPLAPAIASADQNTTGGPAPCSSLTNEQLAFAEDDGELGRTAEELANDYQYSGLYQAGDFGAGVTVALLEAEKFQSSDIAAFQQCYGTNASVTAEAVDGGPSSTSEEGEAALDIENVVSLAPKANVLVYESGSKSNAIVEELFSTIASQNRAKVVSSSLAFCETFYTQAEREAENTVLQEAASQGQSILNASGDTGSAACKRLENKVGKEEEVVTMAQAAQPFITAVGGTTSWNSSSTSHHEAVWNGPFEESDGLLVSAGASGGGVSSLWAMPSYQSSANSSLNVINKFSSGKFSYPDELPEPKPCGHSDCREVPDVSADADGRTGYLVFFQGKWEVVGGTSGATPLWAALIALADASSSCRGIPIGFANPALYSIASSNYGANFHDITEAATEPFLGGSSNSPYEFYYEEDAHESGPYPVGPGYDMTTGLGTPNGSTLAASLCSQAAPVFTVGVGNPGAQKGETGHAVSLQISGSDSGGLPLSFSASGLPAGLGISSGGLITGTPTTAGTATVTVTASDSKANSGSTAFTWTLAVPIQPPTVSHVSVSGIAKRKAKLKFTVTAGGNAPSISSIAVKAPNGLAFSRSSKSLAKGIVVQGANGKKIKFKAKVRGAVLTIALSQAQRQATFTISGPAIGVGASLAKKEKARGHKKLKSLSFLVTVTDASNRTTPFTVTTKPVS